MPHSKRLREFHTTRRTDFLTVFAIYQFALAIQYLDVELYLVANDKIFSWATFLAPQHVSFLLFISSIICLVVVITGRGAKLAFASLMICFGGLAVLWMGSLVFGGYWGSWPTVMMYHAFAGLVWFSSGVVDTPRKAKSNG